ncbi:hypothetical protein NPX13_g9453 [Xylaria arbuscula]|uniref:Uncharacterized protein n=1 Tax=Xylaria arbuscula TaxID=114810 RepID=A0A9W8THG6_9PEZI|nr:hypothetical protein NPX13_g9453 [Xylaria arbuscula]
MEHSLRADCQASKDSFPAQEPNMALAPTRRAKSRTGPPRPQAASPSNRGWSKKQNRLLYHVPQADIACSRLRLTSHSGSGT